MMNVEEYMQKHNLSDDMLDSIAKPYEEGNFALSTGKVFTGSHVAKLAKKRVTVAYDVKNIQQVLRLANQRGVKSSDIYRDALEYYLAAQL